MLASGAAEVELNFKIKIKHLSNQQRNIVCKTVCKASYNAGHYNANATECKTLIFNSFLKL